MDWYFIDTHKANQIRAGWLKAKPIIRTKNTRASTLLSLLPIVSVFRKSCAGICVVQGPGSFSSIRTGVLCANALARSLGVPILGINVHTADNVTLLSRRIRQGIKKTVSYVKPEYDKDPNITASRRP